MYVFSFHNFSVAYFFLCISKINKFSTKREKNALGGDYSTAKRYIYSRSRELYFTSPLKTKTLKYQVLKDKANISGSNNNKSSKNLAEALVRGMQVQIKCCKAKSVFTQGANFHFVLGLVC